VAINAYTLTYRVRKKKQMLTQADQVAMNAYADVQSKHQDLMRLEASIKEVLGFRVQGEVSRV
jgi:hypothetical protein